MIKDSNYLNHITHVQICFGPDNFTRIFKQQIKSWWESSGKQNADLSTSNSYQELMYFDTDQVLGLKEIYDIVANREHESDLNIVVVSDSALNGVIYKLNGSNPMNWFKYATTQGYA